MWLRRWLERRKAKAALLAHQLATGHRGTYVTHYYDGSVVEHCMECDFGLPEPR